MSFNPFLESFTTPADLEQGINAVLNFTVSRLNSQTQNPFLLSYSNKALRTAAGDSWGVMNTGKVLWKLTKCRSYITLNII